MYREGRFLFFTQINNLYYLNIKQGIMISSKFFTHR
jgi:hypothetical protein